MFLGAGVSVRRILSSRSEILRITSPYVMHVTASNFRVTRTIILCRVGKKSVRKVFET